MMRRLVSAPRCAVCRKPVDSITEEDDAFGERVTWTVRCHGESERVSLSYVELSNVPSLDFRDAFTTTSPRRLTP